MDEKKKREQKRGVGGEINKGEKNKEGRKVKKKKIRGSRGQDGKGKKNGGLRLGG